MGKELIRHALLDGGARTGNGVELLPRIFHTQFSMNSQNEVGSSK